MNGVWTNNFENVKKFLVWGYAHPDINPIISASGDALNGPCTFINAYGSSMAAINPFISLSATTPVASDTAFANSMNELVNISESAGNPVFNTDHWTRTYSYTRQKQSAGAITFNSWGLYGNIRVGVSSGTLYNVLYYRELFDEPITLIQYDTLKITFRVNVYLDGTVSVSVGS